MTGIKRDGTKVDALDEPLHAWIQGSTAEDVKKAAKKIQDLIDMEIYNPDCEQMVALRAKHMHELAVLNGTLKEFEIKCLNCGRLGKMSISPTLFLEVSLKYCKNTCFFDVLQSFILL